MNGVKITVILDEKMREWLNTILEKRGYKSYAEYVRDCIRKDYEKLQAEAVLNAV